MTKLGLPKKTEGCQKSTLEDILRTPRDQLIGKIFSTNFSLCGGTEAELETNYIQIKMTNLSEEDSQATMLQFINVSANIFCDKEKTNNKLQELINACISHELRNPLNSLIAKNLEKKQLYKEMAALLRRQAPDVLDQIAVKLEKLVESAEVEESSGNVMKFIVQDFLDYSQIKSGKFRQNAHRFNIREGVEKAMSI